MPLSGPVVTISFCLVFIQYNSCSQDYYLSFLHLPTTADFHPLYFVHKVQNGTNAFSISSSTNHVINFV